MEILIFYQTHVCGLFKLICSNDIMNIDKLVIKLATKVICKDNRRKGNKKKPLHGVSTQIGVLSGVTRRKYINLYIVKAQLEELLSFIKM